MNFGELVRPARTNSPTFGADPSREPTRLRAAETTTAARANPDGRRLNRWC
jgi:hypothetical protein